LGGTVSSQHGTGLARTAWVSRQYGPLSPVFRELKAIFDPRQIFNPGKIVGSGLATAPWPLRATQTESVATANGPPAESPAALGPVTSNVTLVSQRRHLVWRDGEMGVESNNCNGCGVCRTEASVKRMCPIFRAEQVEAATPRAKANLMR